MVFCFGGSVCVLGFCCLLWCCVFCVLFGLPLTILRSGSCLPKRTTVGAVTACTAGEKKKLRPLRSAVLG